MSTDRGHGMALVEFALVLPLLIFLSLGSVDLGRALIAYVELEQAAQEGAMYGSFAPSDPAAIEDRVRTSGDGLVPLSDDTEVTVEVCSPVDPKIKVELHHEFALFTPIFSEFLGGTLSLRADAIGSNFTDPPEALPPPCP